MNSDNFNQSSEPNTSAEQWTTDTSDIPEANESPDNPGNPEGPEDYGWDDKSESDYGWDDKSESHDNADIYSNNPDLHDLIRQAAEQEANGEISEEEARRQVKATIGEIATKFATIPDDVAAYDTEPVGQFQIPDALDASGYTINSVG